MLTDVTPVPAIAQRFAGLLEGPRIAADGALVFTDVLGGGLWTCGRDGGAVRELLPKRRGIGGVVPHADGGWVVSGRTLLHLADDGAQRELHADPDARGFNDISTTPDGDLLAGVLRFLPFAGEEPRPGALIRLPAGGGAPETLTEDVVWPNGIGVAGDGRLLLSDYAGKRVLAVPAGAGAAQTFADSPHGSADGLAVDARGGVWIALGEGGGVARFAPDGRLDAVIDLPADFVSSLSFGGEDGRDVLITGIGTLLLARSTVPGAPVAPARV
jgi:gluconolactonase